MGWGLDAAQVHREPQKCLLAYVFGQTYVPKKIESYAIDHGTVLADYTLEGYLPRPPREGRALALKPRRCLFDIYVHSYALIQNSLPIPALFKGHLSSYTHQSPNWVQENLGLKKNKMKYSFMMLPTDANFV
jgi:hypothetical protein